MRLPKIPTKELLNKYPRNSILGVVVVILLFATVVYLIFRIQKAQQENNSLAQKYSASQKELEAIKNLDQVKINQDLKTQIKNVQDTFSGASTAYENLVDLKTIQPKLDKAFDGLFAQILKELSQMNYSSASSDLKDLSAKIKSENDRIVALSTPVSTAPISAPTSNTPPGSGYSRQSVHTDSGDFVVDLAAADLGSAKVIVDTASNSDCSNNCPVLSLGDYVARSGAFAGVNGSYFCPVDYPSCAGKTNSFDLLVMNKNKVYLNAANNVYSTNPAAIFGSGYVRFVGRALEWGRDTGVDGVISNFPLLVSGHNNVAGSSNDAKMTGKSNRAFVANIGNRVFIGIVHNASVADSANAMTALGMENAMNLDSGGSAAFWFDGYKVGPGRNLPNVILFVRK